MCLFAPNRLRLPLGCPAHNRLPQRDRELARADALVRPSTDQLERLVGHLCVPPEGGRNTMTNTLEVAMALHLREAWATMKAG
jgi:hypothetical protein